MACMHMSSVHDHDRCSASGLMMMLIELHSHSSDVIIAAGLEGEL